MRGPENESCYVTLKVEILIAVGFLANVFISDESVQLVLDVTFLVAISLFAGLHGYFNSVAPGELQVCILILACFVH